MTKSQKDICREIDNKEYSMFTQVMTGKIDQLTWLQTMEALMDVDPRSKTVKSQIKLYKSWRHKHLKFAYEELDRANQANECLQMLRANFSSDRGNNNGK